MIPEGMKMRSRAEITTVLCWARDWLDSHELVSMRETQAIYDYMHMMVLEGILLWVTGTPMEAALARADREQAKVDERMKGLIQRMIDTLPTAIERGKPHA